MCDRVKVIQECYINLDYKIDKVDALAKISALSKEIKFKDNLPERFREAVSIIKMNLFLFISACGHIDRVTTIIEYLSYCNNQNIIENDIRNGYEVIKSINIILTLFNICTPEIRSFLTLVMEGMRCTYIRNADDLHHLISYWEEQTNQEIILLEDSDLDAVISYLRIIGNSRLNKIWVQEEIKQKFLWFTTKYFHGLNFPIHIFRSKQELITSKTDDKVNIVSIWSEDIIAAKNLAISLNSNISFVNAHMDFYGNVMPLPYIKLYVVKFHEVSSILKRLDNFVIKRSASEFFWNIMDDDSSNSISICNLFYDGKWQTPLQSTYFIYKNYSYWAKATREDIIRCVHSAQKGFEMWSVRSVESRMQVLTKLAFILRYSGNILLANIVSEWLKSSKYFEKQCYLRKKGVEITKKRNPLGIIVLKEKDELKLFDRLLQILITGNVVIVICDYDSSSIAPFCDMFSTSEIPSGVINLLSDEDTSWLELSLCRNDYNKYAKNIFTKSDSSTYFHLTQPKLIVLPLK